MITQTGLAKVAAKIVETISHGQCVIDGVQQNVPVHSTKLNGNVLSVYLLLDNTYSGKLTEIKLIDTDGDVFDEEADSIQKLTKNLLLITFHYTIFGYREVR